MFLRHEGIREMPVTGLHQLKELDQLQQTHHFALSRPMMVSRFVLTLRSDVHQDQIRTINY